MRDFIIVIVQLLGLFALGLFARYFLPNYMEEKAKNLATKEDITEITEQVEHIKHQYNQQIESLKVSLNKDFQEYIDDQKFLKERSYEQFCELYSDLYSIIIQSEYIRYLYDIKGNFDEIPYLELSKERIKENINLKNMVVKSEREKIEDAITNFNKISISEKIIEKGHLASEKLLKLAVAYRFIHKYYTDESIEKELINKYQDEELELIREIVKTIVRQTNEFKKICKLNYNEAEMTGKIMSWQSVKE